MSSAALLIAAIARPLSAESAGSDAAAQHRGEEQHPEIIVVAPPLFRDVRPERNLDEIAIESYGVSTVDELLAEIRSETGEDEDPVLLVNGERIYDVDEIGAYPVEVLQQLQVLPRGSAVRLGGSSGQRVISLKLHRQMRSATVVVAPRLATEGDWGATRAETILTHVRGQTRANIAIRARDEQALLESDRSIIQPEPRLPFAINGNVIAYPDLSGEIDPLLSDVGGHVISVAPVPSSANPVIGDFVSGQPNSTDLGEFRTLRPSIRSYDFNASYRTRLAPWLSSNATVRFGRSTSSSLLGLPSALFVLGSDSPFSPFSTDVALAFYGSDPLHGRFRRDSGEGNLTLNARFGQWSASFNARHRIAWTNSRTEQQNHSGAVPLIGSLNPFSTDLVEAVAIRDDRATSRTRSSTALLNLIGPAVTLPGGPLQTTVEARLAWHHMRSRSNFSGQDAARSLGRAEQSVRGALDIPIASRRAGFVPEAGELRATAEYSRVHISDTGTLHQQALALVWEPVTALRLRGGFESARPAPSVEVLGDPVVVTPGVRIFDPLTGETVDIVQISGGNPFLLPERIQSKRASALLRLVPSLGLQFSGEYTDSTRRNFVSSLPAASLPIMLAFPDRFVRNDSGVLAMVDLRPVNFAAHHEKRLRYGLSLNAPLGSAGLSRTRATAAAAPADSADDPEDAQIPTGPRTRVLLTANHSILFKDKILIRPGLDPVDLLEGGAIGIAGGRVRHQLDATAAITSGGTGVRMGANWRGASVLEARVGGTSEQLRFSPLLVVNLRAFTDAKRLLPNAPWASATRLSLNVLNLANQRQEVRDRFGITPLQYQPGYRDPLGRIVEFELRTVF